MRVLRGRAETIDADHERTDAMVEQATETREPALRVWTPHRQLAFGRRDARAEGYDRARTIAEQRGYPPIEREVGGRAVAFTGSTVSLVYAEPDPDRTAVQARYERATERVLDALDSLGVDAERGEPEASFCPGTHSLQVEGKLVGLAQRIRRDVALTSAIVLVSDHGVIADVLAPVYDALDMPFRRDSVGSVARAGGPADPNAVCDALVDAFASVRET